MIARAFAALVPLTLAFAPFVACAGNKGESPSAQSPASGAAAAPGAAAGPAAAATPDTAPSASTTTTMTLADGGDLQGTKLETKTSSTVSTGTVGGDQPKGGHEPGRRREDIQAIVVAHRDEARACYDNALKDHPGIEGNLDIKWKIDPQGVVSEIAVDESKSDIHESTTQKCIMDIIQKLHFAASAKGMETRAHYPFNFHPHGVPQPAPKH